MNAEVAEQKATKFKPKSCSTRFSEVAAYASQYIVYVFTKKKKKKIDKNGDVVNGFPSIRCARTCITWLDAKIDRRITTN